MVEGARHVGQQAGRDGGLQRGESPRRRASSPTSTISSASNSRPITEAISSSARPRRAQLADPVRHRLAHQLGYAAGVDRLAALAGDGPGSLSARAHLVDQRLDQEGVAAGVLVDRLGQLGLAAAAADRGDQLGHLGGLRPPRRRRSKSRSRPRSARVSARAGLGSVSPVGGQHHQRRRVGGAGDVAQHQQRAGVGPLQVVDHEQRRAVARRSPPACRSPRRRGDRERPRRPSRPRPAAGRRSPAPATPAPAAFGPEVAAPARRAAC